MWEHIIPTEIEVLPRNKSRLISLNDNEIVILGGNNSSIDAMNEIAVFNIANRSLEKRQIVVKN